MTKEDKYIEEGQRLIKELYETPDGGVGGYGHIVFDDDNIDDGFIDGCIEDAILGTNAEWLDEETRIASLNALTFFRILTEEQREKVLGIYEDTTE